MRYLLSILAAVVLAGCAATDVDVEGRDFMVQEASVAPNETRASRDLMASLVGSSGPTYVTMVVFEPDTQGTQAGKEASPKSPITSGSGFVVDSSGYVMTAGHVAVAKGNGVSARAANGRIYSGTVVDVLPGNDMALVKLRGFSGKAVTPATSQCVAKGAMVYSLGKPHAQGDTARIGKLDSMHFGRAVAYGKFGYPDAMVLRMNTQKGESGGPLFNGEGRLVGMVVSTLFDGNGRPINQAHAVPVSNLAGFLCKHVQCKGSWQTLASASADNCPDI